MDIEKKMTAWLTKTEVERAVRMYVTEYLKDTDLQPLSIVMPCAGLPAVAVSLIVTEESE